MYRVVVLLIFAEALSPMLGQQTLVQSTEVSEVMPQPGLPYYDRNACPGEGCIYGKWVARQNLKVFDTYKDRRRQIAELRSGDKVVGITGVVITRKPGVIRMDRDLTDRGLRRGDTILTYAYRGEGTSAVWFKGKYLSDYDISFAKWPDGSGCGGVYCAATYLELGDKAWWAEVKLRSGAIGWIDMDHAKLDGACALAGLR